MKRQEVALIRKGAVGGFGGVNMQGDVDMEYCFESGE